MESWVELKKEDFEEILGRFDAGKYKAHRHIEWAYDNTVYILETSKGKFVLKVLGDVRLPYLRFQIKVMNYLSKHDLPVQQVIPLKEGDYVLAFKGSKVTLLEYLDGDHVWHICEKMVRDVAQVQSRMNKLLQSSGIKSVVKWDEGYQFGPVNLLANRVGNFGLVGNAKEVVRELNTLDRSKLTRGIVHGDLTNVNMLVKKGRLTGIIDWDGLREDYLAYDIAIFIAHSLVTPRSIRKKQIKMYLREYQKNLVIGNEDRRAIFYFMKYRCITAAAWCQRKGKSHNSSIAAKAAIRFVERYQRLGKMSLEEFLLLF